MTSKCKHNVDRFVLDAQPLAIKTIHALRYINVLTVKKTMHRITKNAVFINESMIFSILEYHRMYLFLKLVQFKKTHGQRVMKVCWGHQGYDPVHISMYTD